MRRCDFCGNDNGIHSAMCALGSSFGSGLESPTLAERMRDVRRKFSADERREAEGVAAEEETLS